MAGVGLRHASHSTLSVQGHTIRLGNTDSVWHALAAKGLVPRSNCGGDGRCGACRVRITRGPIPVPTRLETRRLSSEEIEAGIRLACGLRPRTDIAIELCFDPVDPLGSICDISDLPTDDTRFHGEHRLAVDLGTSTIKSSLVSASGGTRAAARSCPNPQVAFGTDVLERLTHGAASEEAAHRLSDSARTGVMALAESLRSDGDPTIRRVMIVGNTAMLALFAGRNHQQLLDPAYWSVSIDIGTHETLCEGTEVVLVPPIAGFVGSDLTASVLHTRLMSHQPPVMLIDFGTNTEIALWDGSSLWVTSTAGGPAFEGSGISCGMPAAHGAVCRVSPAPDEAHFEIEVIGNGSPRGICGSGIVDAIAVALQRHLLKPSGRIVTPAADRSVRFPHDRGEIVLASRDIDVFQRAKAAVGAAMAALFNRAEVNERKLDHLFVCGSFGSRLNTANACRIGLLPDLPGDRYTLVAHAALAGCEELLLSDDWSSMVEGIVERVRYVNLAEDSVFADGFPDHLRLRPFGHDRTRSENQYV